MAGLIMVLATTRVDAQFVMLTECLLAGRAVMEAQLTKDLRHVVTMATKGRKFISNLLRSLLHHHLVVAVHVVAVVRAAVAAADQADHNS